MLFCIMTPRVEFILAVTVIEDEAANIGPTS
jgi:hypothetical protein